MAENEQEKANVDPQEVMNEQESQGLALLKSITDPIHNEIALLGNMIKSNSKLIQQMAKNKPAEAQSIIPPELAKMLEKVVPGILNGLFKAFTEPSVDPAAASKGIFGEDMMKAFKETTIAQWKINSDIAAESLLALKKENALRDKRLLEKW